VDFDAAAYYYAPDPIKESILAEWHAANMHRLRFDFSKQPSIVELKAERSDLLCQFSDTNVILRRVKRSIENWCYLNSMSPGSAIDSPTTKIQRIMTFTSLLDFTQTSTRVLAEWTALLP
jgi:hypothetical protein